MRAYGRPLVVEAIDRVIAATVALLGLALVGALIVLPLAPSLALLGIGACISTLHAFVRDTVRAQFRLLGIGVCGALYASFLIAGGQADMTVVRLLAALGLGCLVLIAGTHRAALA